MALREILGKAGTLQIGLGLGPAQCSCTQCDCFVTARINAAFADLLFGLKQSNLFGSFAVRRTDQFGFELQTGNLVLVSGEAFTGLQQLVKGPFLPVELNGLLRMFPSAVADCLGFFTVQRNCNNPTRKSNASCWWRFGVG